jgi:hypothetical protein
MEALQSSRAELKIVNAEKRKLEEQERHRKRKQNHDEDPTHASLYVRLCCLYLYVLAGYDARVGREWLFQSRQKREAPGFPIEVLDRVIVDWFLAWPVDTLDELVVPVTGVQKRAHGAAMMYFERYELGMWVANHNVARGLAPRTSAVADQYERIRDNTGSSLGIDHGQRRSNLGLAKNKIFFTRWRKQFGVKLGRIPPSGFLTTAEKRAKVPARTAAQPP